MKRIIAATFLATTATLAFAGPYDQPYSQIVTERHFPSADPDVLPVLINRVDDVTQYDPRGAVPPGKHQVTVDLHARKGFPATQVTFELDTKACTRYYIAAKLKSRTLQEWEPFVRTEEPLVDCAAKFKLASTGAK
ncbi:MAG TPA: hypothetical protein VGI57_02760 [Usitatibacter sp.]|jgi:hypothetical protein